MFNNRNKQRGGKIDTLVGRNTELLGDVNFRGGLHIDGRVKGNVKADDDENSLLTVSEHGHIEGEVNVPFIVLNGTVHGDVHARQRIELAARARVNGNVYYNLIEMAMGAEVNGSLVHRAEVPQDLAEVDDQTSKGQAQGANSPESDSKPNLSIADNT